MENKPAIVIESYSQDIFSVLRLAKSAAVFAGWEESEIDKIIVESMSKDHLYFWTVMCKYFDVFQV